jgi:hypothetical protein
VIDSTYYIFTWDGDNFEQSWSTRDRQKALEHAVGVAEENEIMSSVMLRVPIAGFPELRAISVYAEDGRCVWETDVYTPELV